MQLPRLWLAAALNRLRLFIAKETCMASYIQTWVETALLTWF